MVLEIFINSTAAKPYVDLTASINFQNQVSAVNQLCNLHSIMINFTLSHD